MLVGLFGLTRWRPVDLSRLRERRAFGQLLRTARRLYHHHWVTLVPIGLIALVRELARGRQSGVRDSLRGMVSRFWRVVAAQLMVTFALLLLTVVGIPIAAWKYVSWFFVQQEVLFTDKSIARPSVAAPSWSAGAGGTPSGVAAVLWLLSVAAGPMLGFALIFTDFPLVWINVIGSVVFALFIPFVTVGQTLLYFDLQVRAEEEPAPRRRLLKRWRSEPVVPWSPNRRLSNHATG